MKKSVKGKEGYLHIGILVAAVVLVVVAVYGGNHHTKKEKAEGEEVGAAYVDETVEVDIGKKVGAEQDRDIAYAEALERIAQADLTWEETSLAHARKVVADYETKATVDALLAVEKAERTQKGTDYDNARELVSKLPVSEVEDDLIRRLGELELARQVSETVKGGDDTDE